MVKLESKYIKDKLRAKFNDLEVYNPQLFKEIHKELCELIKENSRQIELEDGFDIQIDNVIKIMRFMLNNLSNLEDVEYWNNISDEKLEEMLNLADGDFKQVIDNLYDIMVEIAQDIRKENVRKLKLAENRLIELTETFKFNNDIDEKLKEFGIDTGTIAVIQNLLIGQVSEQNLIENKL